MSHTYHIFGLPLSRPENHRGLTKIIEILKYARGISIKMEFQRIFTFISQLNSCQGHIFHNLEVSFDLVVEFSFAPLIDLRKVSLCPLSLVHFSLVHQSFSRNCLSITPLHQGCSFLSRLKCKCKLSNVL